MTTMTPKTATSVQAKSLSLRRLHKTYATRGRAPFEAVKGINLEIEPGELVALLGPSGCGKTTTLRMIAGLETVTSGDILVAGESIAALPPGKRNMGVGFESYALYPPLDVLGNLAYGLKARKVKDADARVRALASRLEMDELLPLRPAALSSGQKQRVALARALVRNPPVLLLDEPLSHLDAAQRQRVRRELKVLQREFGYTTIVVTHDQLEALSLADRLAVMDAGIIKQFGTPDEIYDDPANRFVADFVGEPKINLFEGTVERRGEGCVVHVGNDSILLCNASTPVDGAPVIVGLRPQDAVVSDRRDTDGLGVAGTVFVFEHLLEHGLATISVLGLDEVIVAQTAPDQVFTSGQELVMNAPAHRVYLFDPVSEERVR